MSTTPASVYTIRSSFQRLHCPTQTRSLHFPSNPFNFAKLAKSSLSLKQSGTKNLTIPRATPSSLPPNNFEGKCYVLGDNIDTDQIIPTEHLNLVQSKPDEYTKLGSFAFSGLPSSLYPIPFIQPGADSIQYPIIIAGANFGSGLSHEHAHAALAAAGVQAVVSESYARTFFRNSVAPRVVYPLEFEQEGVNKQFKTGDIVCIDLDWKYMCNTSIYKHYDLKPSEMLDQLLTQGAFLRKQGNLE